MPTTKLGFVEFSLCNKYQGWDWIIIETLLGLSLLVTEKRFGTLGRIRLEDWFL